MRVWDLFLEESQLQARLSNSPLTDETVRDSVLRAARALVSRADRDSVKDETYRERMVNLAFAVGPYKTLLESLDSITSSPTAPANVILDLFERAAIVEIYALGQIARERVESIEQLRRLISDSSTNERQLQSLIEGAQWILYPDWTPLSQNQRLSTTRTNFESWVSLTISERKSSLRPLVIPPNNLTLSMLNHEGRIEVCRDQAPSLCGLPDDEFRRAVRYFDCGQGFYQRNQ